MMFRSGVDAIVVDTFLLSCRALGRGVEHRMLAELGKIARQRGLPAVEARYVRSPRNRPALLFLESAGLEFQTVRGESLLFRFPAGIRRRGRLPAGPNSGLHRFPARGDIGEGSATQRRAISYHRIATELRTVEQILVPALSIAAGRRPLPPLRLRPERRR